MQVEAQIGSIARPLLMLNFGTRWGWVVNAMPMATLPMGKSPVTFCRGGWVVPTVGLEGCRRSRPHRGSNPNRPARSAVAIPTVLFRLLR